MEGNFFALMGWGCISGDLLSERRLRFWRGQSSHEERFWFPITIVGAVSDRKSFHRNTAITARNEKRRANQRFPRLGNCVLWIGSPHFFIAWFWFPCSSPSANRPLPHCNFLSALLALAIGRNPYFIWGVFLCSLCTYYSKRFSRIGRYIGTCFTARQRPFQRLQRTSHCSKC